MEYLPIILLVVVVLVILVRCIYVVQQSRAYVVERLGAFSAVWQVGMHFKVPFIERVAKRVSLKEQVVDGDLLPDHRPQALYLRCGAPHERHREPHRHHPA